MMILLLHYGTTPKLKLPTIYIEPTLLLYAWLLHLRYHIWTRAQTNIRLFSEYSNIRLFDYDFEYLNNRFKQNI